MYGGRNCTGETLQWNECNTQPCVGESPSDILFKLPGLSIDIIALITTVPQTIVFDMHKNSQDGFTGGCGRCY